LRSEIRGMDRVRMTSVAPIGEPVLSVRNLGGGIMVPAVMIALFEPRIAPVLCGASTSRETACGKQHDPKSAER
jgi:hypothetical protein